MPQRRGAGRRRCRRAATASPTSSRWRASPTCCCNPARRIDYDGQRRTYPDIKLVYWGGGNPFHHHQDLHRLREAFARPDTVVVHDRTGRPWRATPTSSCPATMTLERDDIGGVAERPLLVAMHRAVAAVSAKPATTTRSSPSSAERLGVGGGVHRGPNARQWLRHLYEQTRAALAAHGARAPDFDDFWAGGELEMPSRPTTAGFCRALPRRSRGAAAADAEREDRDLLGDDRRASATPTAPATRPGWSRRMARRAGAAVPAAAGRQPAATRLHSQLDVGAHRRRARSRAASRCGCNPPTPQRAASPTATSSASSTTAAAAWPGVRSPRTCGPASSSCRPAPGSIRCSTRNHPKAEKPLCVHGNPNVLTRDVGTSRLAQGSTGQIARIQIERFDGPLPPVRAFDPPSGASGGA